MLSAELTLGAIQVLRNAVGGERVSDFPEKSVIKINGSTLLALRGGGWVSIVQKKCYVTLEWPLKLCFKIFNSTA